MPKFLERNHLKRYLNFNLFRLRDINAAAQAEKTAAVREAEVLRTENVELVRAAEIARKTAADADMRIHDYQEQVNAFTMHRAQN